VRCFPEEFARLARQQPGTRCRNQGRGHRGVWWANCLRVGPIAYKAIPALVAAVKMAGPQVKQINARAREDHDYLTATLTQFKLDLEQGTTDRLLIRSRR
jgi:hypothetical protein